MVTNIYYQSDSRVQKIYFFSHGSRTSSPSIPVDQVWHLHLLYTHSYWDQLCTEVLKKPLHHNPGTGGKEEGLKYQNLREQTLKTYRNYFGTPPADIWDDSHLRSKSINFQWIDSQQYWILPNPIYWLKR